MKKGQATGIFSLVALAFGILMLVITQGLGGVLLGEMEGQVNDANATAIINQGQADMNSFAGWNSLIILMVVITFILGLLLYKFRGVFAGASSGV